MTRRRRDTSGANKNQNREFPETYSQWETTVFDRAVVFKSVLWTGPGTYSVREFASLADAIADAETRKGQHGRVPIVTAVTKEGRWVTLDRSAWPALQRRRARRFSGDYCLLEDGKVIHRDED